MIKFRAWDNECKVIREYDELKGLTFDALDASGFELEQSTGLKMPMARKFTRATSLNFSALTKKSEQKENLELSYIKPIDMAPDLIRLFKIRNMVMVE